jgi:hypothetical protein
LGKGAGMGQYPWYQAYASELQGPFANIFFFLEKHNPHKRLPTYYSFRFLTILKCLHMKITI